MPLPSAQEFDDHCRATLAQLVPWARRTFHLPNLVVHLNILNDSKASWLGEAHKQRKSKDFEIRIQSHDFLNHKHLGVTEYGNFSRNPLISGFETTDWQLGADTLLAHELSHVVLFGLRDQQALVDHRVSWKPHGRKFQEIYGRFRTQWINDRIEPGALRNPPGNFHYDAEYQESQILPHPLTGVEFQFRNETMVVLGRNPKNTRFFRYMVRRGNGDIARIKLSLVAKYSAGARKLIEQSPELKAELHQLIQGIKNAREGSRKGWKKRKLPC
jgi:hypothetical protein